MVFTGFDYNEVERGRRENVEEKLREGSPVVGISYDRGLLLLTIRRTQRKVFEIYDRLVYSAIGNQSDIETIRLGTIDAAHREGFERSPDDVTAQRLVGFALSPALKRIFGDLSNAPAVIRAIFGELGASPESDAFFILNYDGEFAQASRFAAVAGTTEAESQMAGRLDGEVPNLQEALSRAMAAWAAGAMDSRTRRMGADDSGEEDRRNESASDGPGEDELAAFLRQELETATVEAGILDRATSRESKFRLLSESELEEAVSRFR